MNLASLNDASGAAICLSRHRTNAIRRLDVADAGDNPPMSESLPVLAGVLRRAPESDALVILGRLLDSLPIPVLLTDCSDELRCLYGNAASRSWVPPEKFPLEGQSLLEILESLAASPLLAIMRQVCATGAPAHLRKFEYVGLVGAPITLPGDVTVWDWAVY